MNATTTELACIGEPISWLRLERYVLERSGDPHVSDHVTSCPACRACLQEIERDIVALPPLAIPVAKARPRRWWTFALPAGLSLAAAAALLFLILRPRDQAVIPEHRTSVKGVGTVDVDVVRERDGVVTESVYRFERGDRWKVVLTCAAGKPAWIDVAVVESGAAGVDYPLPPAQIVCGNRIALTGAFSLTTATPHRVCVRVATDAVPSRQPLTPGEPGVACVTLRPESND
jgi:hypothetical protein